MLFPGMGTTAVVSRHICRSMNGGAQWCAAHTTRSRRQSEHAPHKGWEGTAAWASGHPPSGHGQERSTRGERKRARIPDTVATRAESAAAWERLNLIHHWSLSGRTGRSRWAACFARRSKAENVPAIQQEQWAALPACCSRAEAGHSHQVAAPARAAAPPYACPSAHTSGSDETSGLEAWASDYANAPTFRILRNPVAGAAYAARVPSQSEWGAAERKRVVQMGCGAHFVRGGAVCS